MTGWEPCCTDGPGDFKRDLTVPGYWALIAPSTGGCDWAVVDAATGISVAGAFAADEDAAMAAVTAWEEENQP